MGSGVRMAPCSAGRRCSEGKEEEARDVGGGGGGGVGAAEEEAEATSAAEREGDAGGEGEGEGEPSARSAGVAPFVLVGVAGSDAATSSFAPASTAARGLDKEGEGAPVEKPAASR